MNNENHAKHIVQDAQREHELSRLHHDIKHSKLDEGDKAAFTMALVGGKVGLLVGGPAGGAIGALVGLAGGIISKLR